MSIKGEIYRMTIASEEILGTLEAMSNIPANLMPSGARSLLKKFQVQATKIQVGIATPAYVNTGVNISRVKSVSLRDLGEDEFQGTNAGIVTPDMLSDIGDSNNQSTKPSADLTAEEEAFLLAEEKRMLAEVAGNGAGSDNVIPERRKVPRTLQETISISDL